MTEAGGSVSATRRLLRRLRDIMAGSGTAQERLEQIVRVVASEMVAEVCSIYCATANPVSVIVASEGEGRGVLGVIDGSSPKGIEGEKERTDRHAMLRKFGYKQ